VGDTYSENARLKAGAALAKSGLPSLGDDSGLEVEALGSFPGIKSARLGPTQKERTAELLRRLEGVPRPWKARFVCVIALAMPGRETRFFEGECRGEVVPEWRGEAGFGYDPIFRCPGLARRSARCRRRRTQIQPPRRGSSRAAEIGCRSQSSSLD